MRTFDKLEKDAANWELTVKTQPVRVTFRRREATAARLKLHASSQEPPEIRKGDPGEA